MRDFSKGKLILIFGKAKPSVSSTGLGFLMMETHIDISTIFLGQIQLHQRFVSVTMHRGFTLVK